MGTITVGLFLLAVITLIITKMVSDRKSGKSSCGCGCKSCPHSKECNMK